jgi:hypothetical protein
VARVAPELKTLLASEILSGVSIELDFLRAAAAAVQNFICRSAKLYTELYTGDFFDFCRVRKRLFLLVGAPRFELGTPCTPCKCATRLRHAPTRLFLLERTRAPAGDLPRA